MDFDQGILQQLIEAFKFELDENLQMVSEKILFLETNDKSSEESSLAINDLFRAFHTIKGSGHAVGLLNIANLAHSLEDLYSKIKKDPYLINSDIIDLTLDVASEMQKAFSYYLKNNIDEYELNNILEKTNSIIDSISTESDSFIHDDSNFINEDLNKSTKRKIKIYKSDDGFNKFKNLDKEKSDKKKAHKKNTKKSLFLESSEQLKIPYNKIMNVSALGDELKNIMIELTDDFFSYEYRIQNKYIDLKKDINYFTGLLKNHPDIRQEFLKTSNHIDHFFNEISDFADDVRENSSRLNLTLDVLRDNFQELSLVSISLLINTLHIIVRDLAKKFNKVIKLSVIGDDIKIDRNVLEKIKDPLIHIIRNAIDHGIESPDKRQKLGKPEVGHIIINIGYHSGRGVITVEDDGSGIKNQDIKKNAIDKKIVSEDELDDMTDDEILKLIFKPGYSSKTEVTEISGRGVGLDIVANNITLIKGKFDINTKENMGTKFILDLPLSLATENGIIIKASEQKFVVPALAIKKIVEINKHELKSLESEKVIIINNKAIPVYEINKLLQINNSLNYNESIIILIISVANEPEIGLIVDDVINQREVIVKRLSEPLNSISCISGIATIGKEGLLVVLNAAEIVKLAISSPQEISLNQNNFSSNKINKNIDYAIDDSLIASNKSRILVVDDSITTRTLLTNALKIKDYDVDTSNNGKEAWELLQTKKFDLVITDIMMPIMDGFELTYKIKSSKDLSGIPVIIVTSLAKDDDRKKGIEVGADAYLVKKHFQNSELIELVSKLLIT